MTFMNNNANIKQFQLIKFLNENVNDDHVISRISIVEFQLYFVETN